MVKPPKKFFVHLNINQLTSWRDVCTHILGLLAYLWWHEMIGFLGLQITMLYTGDINIYGWYMRDGWYINVPRQLASSKPWFRICTSTQAWWMIILIRSKWWVEVGKTIYSVNIDIFALNKREIYSEGNLKGSKHSPPHPHVGSPVRPRPWSWSRSESKSSLRSYESYGLLFLKLWPFRRLSTWHCDHNSL